MCGGGGGGDGGNVGISGEEGGQGGISGGSGGNVAGNPSGEAGSGGFIGEAEQAENTQDVAPTPSTFGGEGSDIGGLVGEPAQINFSKKGFELGTLIGSLFGAGGAALGGIIGGTAPSAIGGSGIPGGVDMSGDPTGGNVIGGPDLTPAIEPGTEKPKVAPDAVADEPIGPSLEDVEKDARKEEDEKARKRPKTILTSPLGLTGKAPIKRATLLGG